MALTAAVWLLAARLLAGESCPEGMALVNGKFCMDRYEASLELSDGQGGWSSYDPFSTVDGKRVRARSIRGVTPQGYVSGVEAAKACAEAGKRLCTEGEFYLACAGASNTTYPYGNDRSEGLCNDGPRAQHPIVELFGSADKKYFDPVHMNDRRINQLKDGLLKTGKKPFCKSSWGIYDLVGNLQEWVATETGTFMGGYYVKPDLNGKGCSQKTTAHAPAYHDYSIGFRCCAARD
jgi:sulfatase modifying factor 1